MKLLDRLRRRRDTLYVGLRAGAVGGVTFPTAGDTLGKIDAIAGPGGLSWSCMVCGDMRPEALIGVESATSMLPGGFPMTVNVRYCLDRESCHEGARQRAREAEARV